MSRKKLHFLPLLLALAVLLAACATEPNAPVGAVISGQSESDPSLETTVSEQSEPDESAEEERSEPSEPDVSQEVSSGETSDESEVPPPPEDPILYVSCTQEDLHKGTLLLVNHTAPYDASLYGGELTDVHTSRVTDIQENSYRLPIEKSLLQTLEALQTDLQGAMNDGICLLINDSYRSAEAQQATIDEYLALYGQAYVDKYVAPVGYSEHHTGLAVDLSFYDPANRKILATTSKGAAAHYKWFRENCHRYGLILRYPPERADTIGTSETWHFRYVGVPHASYIASHNLLLEEYLDLLKETSPEQPLSIEIENETGERYSVYYVPAADGETQVPVPADKPYTLSGNNLDGFIVTVQETG